MIDFPASPTTGQTFKTGNTTYKYDGTGWMSTPQSSITPDAPSDGKTYGRKNAAWTEMGGGGVWIGDTPPTNKTSFPLWWNSTTLQLYIWYDDGNSQQWVDTSSDPQPSLPTAMLLQDGTKTAPALAFTTETGLGLYRSSTGRMGAVANGNEVIAWDGAAAGSAVGVWPTVSNGNSSHYNFNQPSGAVNYNAVRLGADQNGYLLSEVLAGTATTKPLMMTFPAGVVMPTRGGALGAFSQYADSPSKNLLMNPQGLINQRAAGAISLSGTAYCDRWKLESPLAANVSISAAPWADAGGNYGAHVMTVLTPKASLAAGEYVMFGQQVEGIFIRDIFWGASQPTPYQQPLTFSGWFYIAAAPFTFNICIRQGGSASYVHPFTLTTVGWNWVKHTIPAPVIGTWPIDNTSGFYFTVCLATASNGTYTTPTADTWIAGNFISHSSCTNFLGLAANSTFAMSAPQLEVGPVASRFARFDFQTELLRCQRYYETSYPYGTAAGVNGVGGQNRIWSHDTSLLLVLTPLYKVEKRIGGIAGSFAAYQPYTGTVHNVRRTTDGSSAVLSDYGGISTKGPNIITAVAGQLVASQWYELAWTANVEF